MKICDNCGVDARNGGDRDMQNSCVMDVTVGI